MKPRQSQVLFSSKNQTPILDKIATPELPLLEEAASELAGFDDFQLLPSAAIDCEHPWGWESTPATTIPASPETGDSGEDQESASEDEHELSAAAAPFWPNEPSHCSQLHGKGSFLDRLDLDRRKQQMAGSSGPLLFATVDSQDCGGVPVGDCCWQQVTDELEPEDSYRPMWCILEQDAGATRVIPFIDGMMCEPPTDGRTYMKLWCWTQVQATGGMIIVPCTTKGATDDLEKADLAWLPPPLSLDDSAVIACAPPSPAPDSYMPEWFSGPIWPFNAEPTTLKLTGLPDELTQEDLLEILDREEFNGYYDFVFLPEKVRDHDNERYAIVNLIGHQYGRALAARLHGKISWGVCDCACPCVTTWALPYQGLPDLVRVYRHVPENALDVPAHLRPQIFSKGWPVPFSSAVPTTE